VNKSVVLARLDAYEKLIRLDKPVGILLLLWPTLWGLWLAASGIPDWRAVLMRSAGCAINDYADRHFDVAVERTKDRPLATGILQPWEALAVAAALSLAAFVLVVRLNLLTIALSVVALLLAASYPFTKRFFAMPQAVLGVAFGFGIPMAFAAQLGRVTALGWALLAAHVLWTIAYDTEYAMVDRNDDVTLGIKTTAILFGKHDVLAVMACYALFLLSMLGIGIWQGYGPFYTGGLLVAAMIAGYHYRLIRDRSREGAFKAFRHNNWLGAAIFAGVLLDQWPR
jgi:4-hydroxybenzoate polyprenyltransferase